jgi:predicted DNA-binding transcriptional regulator AlpA
MSRTPKATINAGQRLVRAKPPVGAGARPPSYMSRKELAWELSVSESTVDVMVRRGIIPPPILLSAGCVRWAWEAVQERLAAASDTMDDADPYMTGAANAAA